MSRIGNFYFDDDTNEFVFGNEENGIRISEDDITFIQNGQRMSFDEMTKQVSSIEWAPIVHGRWIDKPTGKYGRWQAHCSACHKTCGCGGTLETQHKKYCPNCGARMDLEV